MCAMLRSCDAHPAPAPLAAGTHCALWHPCPRPRTPTVCLWPLDQWATVSARFSGRRVFCCACVLDVAPARCSATTPIASGHRHRVLCARADALSVTLQSVGHTVSPSGSPSARRAAARTPRSRLLLCGRACPSVGRGVLGRCHGCLGALATCGGRHRGGVWP